MNLRTLYLSQNNCFLMGRTQIPKGIMLHSTGRDNPYLKRYVGPDDGLLGENINANHWNTALPGGENVCVHAFVGKLADGSVATYNVLPWDIEGRHSGSGAMGYEHRADKLGYIGIELCEDDLANREYFDRVYNEAAELCAYLCKLYALNPKANGVLISHKEGYDKGMAAKGTDADHWLHRHKKSMDMFRGDTSMLLSNMTPYAPKSGVMTQGQFDAMMNEWLAGQSRRPPSDWSRESRRWAESIGLCPGGPGGGLYKKPCTREETIELLYRMWGILS